MSKGRHRLTPGARKAPPEARRASPARVGGAEVAGRRVAGGDGRPAVLTTLRSGEKLFALVPLAVLSVASVAGLAALGNGDPTTSPSPADPGSAAGSVGQQTARGSTPAQAVPTSARPTISETVAPERTDQDPVSLSSVDEEPSPTHDSTTAGSRVEPPPAPAPRHRAEDSTPPAPTASPTADPEPTEGDALTKAEATAQCVASGISALDLAALGACVEDLLG